MVLARHCQLARSWRLPNCCLPVTWCQFLAHSQFWQLSVFNLQQTFFNSVPAVIFFYISHCNSKPVILRCICVVSAMTEISMALLTSFWTLARTLLSKISIIFAIVHTCRLRDMDTNGSRYNAVLQTWTLPKHELDDPMKIVVVFIVLMNRRFSEG